MRRLIFLVCMGLALSAASARAEDTPRDIKGLFLVTDYPAVTLRPGTTSTVSTPFSIQRRSCPGRWRSRVTF